MPSNHLILCRPLLLLSPILLSIRVFSNESILCMRWPTYWSFSFNISPSSEYNIGLNCMGPLICGVFCLFVCFINTVLIFFILKIFQLTKCGEIFVFNWRSEIVESKELGYRFWFSPNCFSFLPLCESFYQVLCFWSRDSSIRIFSLWCGRRQRVIPLIPFLLKVQLQFSFWVCMFFTRPLGSE